MSLVLDGGNTIVSRMDGENFLKLYNACKLWDGNRVIDQERVKKIADNEQRSYATTKTYHFSDVPIVICEFNGQKLIIDGQHRMVAWVHLKCPYETEWLVRITSCKKEEEVCRIFESINCGTPVSSNYYLEKVNSVISNALRKFGEKYDIVSKSSQCQRPNINLERTRDNFGMNIPLRDLIAAGKVSADLLLNSIYEVNNQVKINNRGNPKKFPVKCYAMAETKDCFITLEIGWENLVISHLLGRLVQ